MPSFDPLADLDAAAYAPFRDPRDYILSWTDQIWIDKGLGRLGEHYARDIKVHTAYGETYDFDSCADEQRAEDERLSQWRGRLG